MQAPTGELTVSHAVRRTVTLKRRSSHVCLKAPMLLHVLINGIGVKDIEVHCLNLPEE